MTEERTCSVILPTYDEEDNIGEMISQLRELYPDFPILVMDDNSTDRSREIVESMGCKGVRFIVRDKDDRGLNASVCEGIVTSGTDLFIVMDSDFQHPVETAGRIYDELNKGHDLVIGRRSDRKALGFKRSAGSWIFHVFASSVLFVHGKRRSKDVMSGLFGGDTAVFSKVIEEHGERFEKKGFKVLFDLMRFAPSDINVGEITYEFGKRMGGESKVSPKIVYLTLRQCGIVGRFFAGIYKAVFIH